MRSASRLVAWGSLAAAALLAACDDAKPERGSITIAAHSTATISAAGPGEVASTPLATPPEIAEIIKNDTIEPDTGPPPHDPNPPKLTANPIDFTPPPLPPELLDDGGLKPLPTRRPPSTSPAN